MQLLTSCFQFIYDGLKWLWQAVNKLFGPIIAAILPVIFPVLYLMHWITGEISYWISRAAGYLDAIQLPGTSLTGLQMLNVANTFFPVTESMVVLTVYLSFLVGLAGYKLVKSWIPTLAGT